MCGCARKGARDRSFVGAERADLCFCQQTLTYPICRWICRLTLVALSVCSCHPAPAVVAPAPAPAPPPPPPPPPLPKCEALTENCTASDGTVLGIGAQGASLTPPSGWRYAKVGERAVSVSSEGKSLLTALEISDGSEAGVLATIEKLSVDSAIEKVKFEALKQRFKKPQITVDANGTKVDLWEVSKSTSNGVNPELREQGAGTVLVFVARLGEGRVIAGLGFVVVPEAEADAEKIMHAVQSLKGTP